MKITVEAIENLIRQLEDQKEKAALEVSSAQRSFQNCEGAANFARSLLVTFEIEKGNT